MVLQAGSGLEVLGLDVFVVFTNGFLNELFTNLLHNMCDFLVNGPLSLKKVIARYLMCQLPMMADGPPCYAGPLIGMGGQGYSRDRGGSQGPCKPETPISQSTLV